MERYGDDDNSGDRRVLCDLVSFELRQFNRIKRVLCFDRCQIRVTLNQWAVSHTNGMDGAGCLPELNQTIQENLAVVTTVQADLAVKPTQKQ